MLGLYCDWAAPGAYNIGILLFRPTNASRRFARQWAEKLAGDDKIWDQNGFNDEMRLHTGPRVQGGSSKNLFWAFDGTLKAGILPVALFCSGHTYFIQVRKAPSLLDADKPSKCTLASTLGLNEASVL